MFYHKEEIVNKSDYTDKEKKEEAEQLNDPSILDGLDHGQKEAVLSENSRTLVLAGAGAGKTRVLLHHILHLIRNKNVNSYHILAVTFTNEATNEMTDRLISFFDKTYSDLIKDNDKKESKSLAKINIQKYPEIRYIHISTIHSLCCKILREDGGKEFNNKFKILSDKSNEPSDIIRNIIYEKGTKDNSFFDDIRNYIILLLIENDTPNLSKNKDNLAKLKLTVDTIETNPKLKDIFENAVVFSSLKLIDFAKSNNVSTKTIKNNLKKEKHEEILSFYKIFIPIYDAYQQYLMEKSLLDFNDMIHRVVNLFKKNHEILAKYQKMFEHILVDEYQDVSASQVEFIKLLLTKDNNLFAVGDDWQSIYGFRGSEVEFIINFEKEFKGSEVSHLPYNYRSGRHIVGASNEVIKKNFNQTKKIINAVNPDGDEKIYQFNALDDKDGAKFIIEATKKFRFQGYKYSDMMLLFRRWYHFHIYEDYFKKYGFKINSKTIHSSKGQEAKIVFLIGLKEGHFPRVWEDPRIVQIIKNVNLAKKDEEERRVFYVAMTRAKEKLFLISEKHNESEYCKDIPPEFKEVHWSETQFDESMLSQIHNEVLKLVKEGKTAKEIAKIKGIEEQIAESYIAKLIYFGVLDINDFLDKYTYKLIKSEIPEGESNPRLNPIKYKLPREITYGQIRYVIADLKRKGNI